MCTNGRNKKRKNIFENNNTNKLKEKTTNGDAPTSKNNNNNNNNTHYETPNEISLQGTRTKKNRDEKPNNSFTLNYKYSLSVCF